MAEHATTQMDLASLPLGELLRSLGERQPTPGGGAATGVIGAIASALAKMVVSYSTGRKDLAAHETALRDASTRLDHAEALFLELAREDAAAYAQVNALMKSRSKSEPESQSSAAEDALLEAMERAIQIPEAMIAASCDLLRLFESLAPITNRMLRSDLAIAAAMAESTARASRWNVAINLGSLPKGSSADAASRLDRVDRILDEARKRLASIESLCA